MGKTGKTWKTGKTGKTGAGGWPDSWLFWTETTIPTSPTPHPATQISPFLLLFEKKDGSMALSPVEFERVFESLDVPAKETSGN